jgi:hypothetical protein
MTFFINSAAHEISFHLIFITRFETIPLFILGINFDREFKITEKKLQVKISE